MFIFLHIPNTAGYSLMELFNGFEKLHYGKVHDMNDKEIQLYKSFNDNDCIIHGHISFNELKIINKPLYETFTIVRNPIQRCLSWYYYTNQGQSIVGKKLSIKDFFSSNHPGIKQNCFNRMCYQLGDYAHISKRDKLLYHVLVRAKENIQKLKCIIVYENLKEDIDKYFETSIPYVNKTQPYNNVLNDEDYEFIKKWNELDIELYNFVMDNLGSKYSQFKL